MNHTNSDVHSARTNCTTIGRETAPRDCIHLRDRFGDKYRIAYEQSYYAERTRHTVDDPWLQIIPGARGHIYPHGCGLLAASTNGRGPTSKRLAAIHGVEVVQDGSDGITATFHPDLIEQVAELIRAKRRRRLSPEARERLVAMGRDNLKKLRQANVGAHCDELVCTIGDTSEI